MSADYKGHNSLAEMIESHICHWREALEVQQRGLSGLDDQDFISHELQALADIEAAAAAELGGDTV